MTVRFSSEVAEERIKRVRSARGSDRTNFCALVERAGLDPAKDLRYGNFSDVDFSGCNLTGYDFTGASLYRCRFDGTQIAGAKFIQCEFPVIARSIDIHIYPEHARDANEAYRQAVSSGIVFPENFDEHIKPGVHFRDFAFGPLMTCVVLTKPDGARVKLALSAMLGEDVTYMARWLKFQPGVNKNMKDYAMSLNETLNLEPHLSYKSVPQGYNFINDKHRPPSYRPAVGNVHISFDLLFETLDARCDDIASDESHILVRRMRPGRN